MISYRLDLVINLIDTTTGLVVDENNARFFKNGQPLTLEHREEGIYILLNSKRDDFTLVCDVYGYEVHNAEIHYDELDENIPLYTAYLLPLDDTSKGESVLSYRDRIPNLKEIEAIILKNPRAAAN